MTFTDSLLQKWNGLISLTCRDSGGNPLLLLIPRVELPSERNPLQRGELI